MQERADVFIHEVTRNTFIKGWLVDIGDGKGQLEIDTITHPNLRNGTIAFDQVLQLWCKGEGYER